nr:hypothetical protein [uncultured Kingella sp.]
MNMRFQAAFLCSESQRVGSKCPPYPFRLCGIGSNTRKEDSLKTWIRIVD